jgi:integrase
MPSLVKDTRNWSPYWICCYRAADGRRLKKSTKQTVRKKAMEVCLAIERAEEFARNRTLTEARARTLVNEVLERTTGASLSHYTVEQWLNHWIAQKSDSKADSTTERYRHVIDEFLASLNGRAKIDIAAVTPSDILAFRRERALKGFAASTMNLDLGLLKSAFKEAKDLGYISVNPCASIKSLEEDTVEKAVFSIEHIRGLMNAAVQADKKNRPIFSAGADWRGLILFGYYTAARLLDGANIRWQAIDLPSKLITYKARKTGAKVVVPIHPELEAYLLALPAPDDPKAFVFPKLAGRSTGGASGLSRTFHAIMKRAKIATQVARKRTKEGRSVYTLSYHSLRHSFSSALANAGVPEELRMKLTGHKTRDAHATYTHHELEALRHAVTRLPKMADA